MYLKPIQARHTAYCNRLCPPPLAFRLALHGVSISMDGRGRALDNMFVERLWRSVKYEEVYLKDYQNGWEAEASLESYFRFYNHERIHLALGYRTPAEVYAEKN